MDNSLPVTLSTFNANPEVRSVSFAFSPNEVVTSDVFAFKANPETRSDEFAFKPNEVVISDVLAFKARFVIVANELTS